MEVTLHAAERFLQRVKNKFNYTKYELLKTKQELNLLFKDLVTNRKKVIVPTFSKFLAVIKNNKVITIIPK